jgi:SAM-dependent methyltransferase
MATSELTVASGNEAQAQAWDGDEGALWALHHTFFEAAVRRHQVRLMQAAEIDQHEKVLDVGCGSGDSTIAAARAASRGQALGIDLSARLVEVAKESARLQRVANATFVHGDAQLSGFDGELFDVVVSRTGSMFFADQVAAFSNIARAVRPGGRMVLVSWQDPRRNEWFWSFVDAMTLGRPPAPPPPEVPSPFAHADPARTERILTAAGWGDVRARSIEEPMYFGRSPEEGHEVMSRQLAWMSDHLAPDERTTALERLRTSLEEHMTTEGVAYRSAAWVITAHRC